MHIFLVMIFPLKPFHTMSPKHPIFQAKFHYVLNLPKNNCKILHEKPQLDESNKLMK